MHKYFLNIHKKPAEKSKMKNISGKTFAIRKMYLFNNSSVKVFRSFY